MHMDDCQESVKPLRPIINNLSARTRTWSYLIIYQWVVRIPLFRWKFSPAFLSASLFYSILIINNLVLNYNKRYIAGSQRLQSFQATMQWNLSLKTLNFTV